MNIVEKTNENLLAFKKTLMNNSFKSIEVKIDLKDSNDEFSRKIIKTSFVNPIIFGSVKVGKKKYGEEDFDTDEDFINECNFITVIDNKEDFNEIAFELDLSTVDSCEFFKKFTHIGVLIRIKNLFYSIVMEERNKNI